MQQAAVAGRMLRLRYIIRTYSFICVARLSCKEFIG